MVCSKACKFVSVITSSFPWRLPWQVRLPWRQQQLGACSAWGWAFSFRPWWACRTCFRTFRRCVCRGGQPCRYLLIDLASNHYKLYPLSHTPPLQGAQRLAVGWKYDLPAGHFSHSILSFWIFPVLSTLKYSRMALGLFLCLWPIFLGLV